MTGNRLRLLLIVLTGMAALTAGAQPVPAPQGKVQLFNRRNLDGWYTWLRDNKYADPKRVFSVTPKGDLRISGEEWGGIATKGEYRDYHLIVEWLWGGNTWGNREKAARDSGILIHGIGEDGAAGGTWLESYEAQIIEGGTGDLLMVAGKGRPAATSTVRESGRETYFDPAGQEATRDRGRINWWGRSPEWKDQIGFRGPKDIEKPVGQWNRQEVFAEGDTLRFLLNGKLVNRAGRLSHSAGKIQIQSEGAEILVRKVELRPLPRPR
jgi:hypothetical protein